MAAARRSPLSVRRTSAPRRHSFGRVASSEARAASLLLTHYTPVIGAGPVSCGSRRRALCCACGLRSTHTTYRIRSDATCTSCMLTARSSREIAHAIRSKSLSLGDDLRA
jgi:hypothetical protein